MATTVTRDHVFFAFSPDMKPVMHVKQGEEVLIETHDCFQEQIRLETDLVTALDWNYVNPSTGPIYIEGAKPGDLLRVDLLEVKAVDQSVMIAVPGEGVLGDVITKIETAVLQYKGNSVVFKNKIEIPQKPMLGVIGISPASGKIPNGLPGDHGGNMDCTLMGSGASLYLTVGVEGALFGCGDMHAVMGDGEIVVCGAETPGEVRLTAQVVSIQDLPTPFLENDDLVAVIASAPTIDEAQSLATHRMADFLTRVVGLPLNDAGMLMSLVGNLKFCQVVDPLLTVRFEFPKWVLEKYDFKMPR